MPKHAVQRRLTETIDYHPSELWRRFGWGLLVGTVLGIALSCGLGMMGG